MKKISMIKEKNKGITLIALVITIILLLILAGISISMLSGENSILIQAINSGDKSRGGEIQEKVILEATNNAGVDYVSGTKKDREQVINELHENGKLKDEEVEKLKESDTITIGGITIDFGVLENNTSSEKLVKMFQNAVQDGCTNADGKCTRKSHLHIGDYVNYSVPTSGEYTVPTDKVGINEPQTYLIEQNQLNWRVLGLEGTGDSKYIKLIAGTPMKKSKIDKSGINEENPYLFMKGAKAYVNSIEQLNNICSICKNEALATNAKSITMDDIDKLTGVTTDEKKRYYNLDYYNGGKNFGDSYNISNQYTPESWLNSKRTTVKGTVNGYYYTINSQEKDYPYINMDNLRIYNMLFDNVLYGSERPYWLATNGTSEINQYVFFDMGYAYRNNEIVMAGTRVIFISSGYEVEFGFGVRPVVYLKPEVTNEQCSKIPDRNEIEWNVGT